MIHKLIALGLVIGVIFEPGINWFGKVIGVFAALICLMLDDE